MPTVIWRRQDDTGLLIDRAAYGPAGLMPPSWQKQEERAAAAAEEEEAAAGVGAAGMPAHLAADAWYDVTTLLRSLIPALPENPAASAEPRCELQTDESFAGTDGICDLCPGGS